MSEGTPGYRRDLWLPTLVGVVGVTLSLAGWGLLVAERRAQILEATQRTSAEVRDAIALGLAQQIAPLEQLTQLWSRFGLRQQAEWMANVGQRVEQVPGLRSIAWVDLDEPLARVSVGTQPSDDEQEIDAQEARRYYPERRIEGPERDASGAIGYRVFLPVRTPKAHAGVLVARFRAAEFLSAALRARGSGLAVSVRWDGEEIFARGDASADAWQDWWRVETRVDLPLGGQWQVVHRPTAEFAAARLTPVPHYLLAAGIVLSLVLALVAHQLRVILRQSRFLSASNRALEQRGLELETKVGDRTRELEEAVAELETFNYSVSHDLRSPLGAILNFAAILEEDYRDRPLDADGVAILARIRRSASRATALLEDLLQLSRAGRAALTFEPVDMQELARETFAQLRAAEPDAADVEFVVEPLPPAMGDRTLLGDVLANLFGNAVKYSRGCEKRRITFSGRRAAGECIYEVSDNGSGFDMRFVDKLFGLFERLHSSEGIEGTGVGLAMVARIVKRHGGRVWAEGRPGEGARFSFALPDGEAQ